MLRIKHVTLIQGYGILLRKNFNLYFISAACPHQYWLLNYCQSWHRLRNIYYMANKPGKKLKSLENQNETN